MKTPCAVLSRRLYLIVIVHRLFLQHTKRKLDDVSKRLEALYDKLREQKVRENPRVPNTKTEEKSQISFCKIWKNKWYHAKVLLKRFHLNGHTIGFRPQTQKLEITLHVSIIDS